MDDQESEIRLFPSSGLHTCSWLFPSGGFSYRSCSKRAFIRCSVSTFFISRFMAVVVKPVAQPRSYKSTIILSDSSPSEQLNLSTTRAFLNTISMFEYLKFSRLTTKIHSNYWIPQEDGRVPSCALIHRSCHCYLDCFDSSIQQSSSYPVRLQPLEKATPHGTWQGWIMRKIRRRFIIMLFRYSDSC